MAINFALSRLKSRQGFVRRLVVRRPALLWFSVVAVLATVPPFYGMVSQHGAIGLISLAAALITTDLALLTLILRRASLRSRADVVATFLAFSVVGAVFLPVLVAVVTSMRGPGSASALLDFLGQGALPLAIPIALLLLVPYAAVIGLLASWLAFDEITDPPNAA